MSDRHLLLLSLGPVQDFIAQARRSRDLWFGSHLLSELSRAAAASLADGGAKLIFPALAKGDPELSPCDAPTRDGHKSPISVANKILAELPADGKPGARAKAAREAVRARWRAVAAEVRRKQASVLADGIDEVWKEQVEDVLEFYSVWVPLRGDYQEARRAAEQSLAGRKNLRDFRPWRQDRTGAPKSSLDGARVSVLAPDRDHPDFRRLRISAGEQLDAIGLIKRAGFEPEQFVPLVNLAAGAWLARAAEDAPQQLAEARVTCAERGIPAVHRRLPVVEPLPYDASVLYPSRWPSLLKEIAAPERSAAAAREWGEARIRPLLRRMRGEPAAYVACLAADGDRMGRTIDSLESADANRAFSKALGRFPDDARRIVEQEHCGSLIYAGGDDVLAFLPVAKAPDCARTLAQAFRAHLSTAVSGDFVPTLSVGIGVGHVLEQMSNLLALGRDAERAAKNVAGGERNALAIVVDKRSGGRRQFVAPWHSNPVDRLMQDAALLDGPLSTGKAYELEALLRRFPDETQVRKPTDTARALAGYAEAVLAHSGDGGKVTLSDIGLGPDADYAALRRALRAAIDRILIARTLGELEFR